MCKVLQQALSVEDGGVELKIGALPLAIQILSAQRTAMATEWIRRERRILHDKIVCVVTVAQVQLQPVYDSIWKLWMSDDIFPFLHYFHLLSIYNSIRVEHGDYLEDVGLPQAGCLRAGAHQELQRAFHYPAGIGLSRVHSGRQEDQWTIP